MLALLVFFVIVFVVENLDESLSDEVHFLNVTLVTDDDLAWDEDSAEHANDQVVGETGLTLFEEVVE